MNLEIFNNFINHVQDNIFMQDLNKELMKYLNGKVSTSMSDELEENCFYQVVDKSADGVFLQNTKNNKIFEETNIPEDMLEGLEPDYILKYQNGEFMFESDLTDDFYNSLLDIREYKEIQEKFVNETNILELDSDTRFKVIEQNDAESVLEYDNGNITVPNALLPFFIYEDTVLKYENGKFENSSDE